MQLPIKAHYATVAMVTLAQNHESGTLIAVRTIADEHRIPQQFLIQIFQQLRAAGMITSIRGSSGGFRLAKSPSTICLADIVDAVCPNSCSSVVGGNSVASNSVVSDVVQEVWQELERAERLQLRRIKLSHLVQRAGSQAEQMFYI